MYAIAIAFLGTMLLSWQAALTGPIESRAHVAAAADTAAANFWAYRQALVVYVSANPGANGTIADSVLTFPMGYLRNSAWTNLVSGGTLYTYSRNALPAVTVDAIARRGGRSLVIGLAQSGATMTSLSGGASGFPIPASIPAGALVVIGT